MRVTGFMLGLTGLFLMASDAFAVQLPELRLYDKIKDRTAKLKLESSSDVVNVNCSERSTEYTFTRYRNLFNGGGWCFFHMEPKDTDRCYLRIEFFLEHDGILSQLNVLGANTPCYNTWCDMEGLNCESNRGINNNGLVTVFPEFNLRIAPKREDRVKFYRGQDVWEIDIDEK